MWLAICWSFPICVGPYKRFIRSKWHSADRCCSPTVRFSTDWVLNMWRKSILITHVSHIFIWNCLTVSEYTMCVCVCVLLTFRFLCRCPILRIPADCTECVCVSRTGLHAISAQLSAWKRKILVSFGAQRMNRVKEQHADAIKTPTKINSKQNAILMRLTR